MLRSPNECMFEVRDDKVIKAIPVADEVPLVEVSENAEGNLVIRFLGGFSTVKRKSTRRSASVCARLV